MPSPTDRIEKQVQLKASLDRVWQALTDYKQFGEWFRVNLDKPFTPGEYTRGNVLYLRSIATRIGASESRRERRGRGEQPWHLGSSAEDLLEEDHQLGVRPARALDFADEAHGVGGSERRVPAHQDEPVHAPRACRGGRGHGYAGAHSRGPAIERLIECYLMHRDSQAERFIDTVRRIGIEPFKEHVYGAPGAQQRDHERLLAVA